MKIGSGSFPLAGKYEPIFELGRGGMATVYLAIVRGPGGFQKLQVIKKLSSALAAEVPELVTMFLDEARLAARINHPNVVQTLEIGAGVGGHFIAMEYLEGQSLSALTRRAGKGFPLGLHLHVLCEVLAGLHFAHELQDYGGKPLRIVHRDVSPHNVIVTYQGVAKLVDFGIAKAADSHSETAHGVIKGKYPYMAPEQFISRGRELDRRADVYAVGVMLWQALVGERLWPQGTPSEEIVSHVTLGKQPLPTARNPDVPKELETICMKALATDRENRFATAAEMKAAITGWLATQDARPTTEEVGALVAGLFEQERTKLAKVIEERLSSGPTNDAIVPHVKSVMPPPADSAQSFDDGVATKSVRTGTRIRSRAVPITAVTLGVLLAGAGVVAKVTAVRSGVGTPTTDARPNPSQQVSAATAEPAPPSASPKKEPPALATTEPSDTPSATVTKTSPAATPAQRTTTSASHVATSTTSTPAPASAPPPSSATTTAKRKPNIDEENPFR